MPPKNWLLIDFDNTMMATNNLPSMPIEASSPPGLGALAWAENPAKNNPKQMNPHRQAESNRDGSRKARAS